MTDLSKEAVLEALYTKKAQLEADLEFAKLLRTDPFHLSGATGAEVYIAVSDMPDLIAKVDKAIEALVNYAGPPVPSSPRMGITVNGKFFPFDAMDIFDD